MAIRIWEPARELQLLQQEMNRLFGSVFDSQAGAPADARLRRQWIPAMDLLEQEDHYVLRADLPGVSRDDVTIELEDQVLTVAGERRSEHEELREGYRRLERATGRFSRSLTLPEGVDAGSIQASFENGVLEVRIPKPAQPKPRKVEISLGGADRAIEGTAQPSTPGEQAAEPPRPGGDGA